VFLDLGPVKHHIKYCEILVPSLRDSDLSRVQMLSGEMGDCEPLSASCCW